MVLMRTNIDIHVFVSDKVENVTRKYNGIMIDADQNKHIFVPLLISVHPSFPKIYTIDIDLQLDVKIVSSSTKTPCYRKSSTCQP